MTYHETLPLGLNRNEYVESFAKGLDVLRALGSKDRSSTITDLAEMTGQSRASARRFALTLVHLGYATQEPTGFSLHPSAIRLAAPDREALELAERAKPLMEEFVARHREASSFGVLDGTEIRILAYARSNRLMSIYLNVGDRLPAVQAAQGRVLLSFLDEDDVERILSANERIRNCEDPTVACALLRKRIKDVRNSGYALVDQELEAGVRSIAVPVYSPRTGRPVAAVSLCAHSNRMSIATLEQECLPDLLKLSQRVTQSNT